MLEACDKLPPLPDNAIDQKAVEKAWSADLEDYEDCRIRHAALRNFYRNRDAKLRGTP